MSSRKAQASVIVSMNEEGVELIVSEDEFSG